MAYAQEALRRVRMINDRVGGQAVGVLWTPGTASALDREEIANSRDVGAAGVFVRTAGGGELTFRFRQGRFEDAQTGSVLDVFGLGGVWAPSGTQAGGDGARDVLLVCLGGVPSGDSGGAAVRGGGGPVGKWACCGREFATEEDLARHDVEVHGAARTPVGICCGVRFFTPQGLEQHRRHAHGQPSTPEQRNE